MAQLNWGHVTAALGRNGFLSHSPTHSVAACCEPSTLGTGHRMDNREPQSCLIGAATTTLVLFSTLHPHRMKAEFQDTGYNVT